MQCEEVIFWILYRCSPMHHALREVLEYLNALNKKHSGLVSSHLDLYSWFKWDNHLTLSLRVLRPNRTNLFSNYTLIFNYFSELPSRNSSNYFSFSRLCYNNDFYVELLYLFSEQNSTTPLSFWFPPPHLYLSS